jgi:hypothetical protein
MKRRVLRWTVVLFAAGAVSAGGWYLARTALSPQGRERRAPLSGFGDRICGPRCVRCLLEHYGIQEELAALVRETQWPDFEAGASLGSLAEALEKRGVHTCALRLSPSGKLTWPHPVLVHLRGAGGRMDHYVIWKPAGTPDGEGEYLEAGALTHLSWAAVAQDRSGVVLLTSPEPITAPEGATDEPAPDRYRGLAYALGAFAVGWAAAYLLSYLLNRRRPVTGGHHEERAVRCRRGAGGVGLARPDVEPAPHPQP